MDREPQQSLSTTQPASLCRKVVLAAGKAGVSQSIWVGHAIGLLLKSGPITEQTATALRKSRTLGRKPSNKPPKRPLS